MRTKKKSLTRKALELYLVIKIFKSLSNSKDEE